MSKLRCARCGLWLSPSGQGLRNGYKLAPFYGRPGGAYSHEFIGVCETELRRQRKMAA
jgi:hypothetical protein